ncbi:transcriptional regulator [Sphaerisporangium rufum]|uniref:Transcriptional regulator n=1 Tax=Sphaerisporangium rufum TaxID=1381558 RepID=A0A919R6W8_9ACTN|nr:transcriptional regulator [Sphaerisporangium rufum]
MTHELAAFLRTRRERLSPADLALRTGGRSRRTPGLRREEVAELAGVSVDYVVRLEQGRGLRPSAEVLDALARALLLDDDERAYLFDLARQRPTARRRAAEAIPASLSRLVHDLSPLPCLLVSQRCDILAWNDEMAALMLDFDLLPEEWHNTLRLCVLHPGYRDFWPDRELIIRQCIADLRAAWAARPDEALDALIDELTSQSAEFARLWAARDVKVNGHGRKRLRHPVAGPLSVDFQVLNPLDDPDRRLVIYRAADPASQAALDSVVQARAAHRTTTAAGHPDAAPDGARGR